MGVIGSMPCIIIRSIKKEHPVDIRSFAHDISELTGINIERISIIVEYYDKEDYFSGSDQEQIIITVNISKNNDPEFIKQLLIIIASLAERYFNRRKKSIAIMCNLIEKGHLFINNKFI